MLLCTFCFSPSRINSSTVCMPSMHTQSYELWGEGEGTAWTFTDKIIKILQQSWELNPLPLPSDFITRPSLLLPTETITHHYRQASGVSRFGQKASDCFEVLWEICRNRSLLFHCDAEDTPFPTEQLTLCSLLIQSALLLLPGINLFQGCTCSFY